MQCLFHYGEIGDMARQSGEIGDMTRQSGKIAVKIWYEFLFVL